MLVAHAATTTGMNVYIVTDDYGAWRTKDRVEVKQVDPGLRYVAFTNNGFGG